jgi:hypothetical protein
MRPTLSLAIALVMLVGCGDVTARVDDGGSGGTLGTGGAAGEIGAANGGASPSNTGGFGGIATSGSGGSTGQAGGGDAGATCTSGSSTDVNNCGSCGLTCSVGVCQDGYCGIGTMHANNRDGGVLPPPCGPVATFGICPSYNQTPSENGYVCAVCSDVAGMFSPIIGDCFFYPDPGFQTKYICVSSCSECN